MRRGRKQTGRPSELSRRDLLELLGLGALGGLTACSGLADLLGLQEPTADYREFSVQSLSLEQVGLDLGFDLGNPNDIALPVASLDWNLDLFEKPFTFGQVLFEEPAGRQDDTNPDGGVLSFLGVQTLPARGELELHTPFTVALLDTFEGIARIALGEDVPWGVGGTFRVDSRLGRFDLPFAVDGVWPNGTLIGFLDDVASDILEDLIFGYQSGQTAG